MPQDEGILVCGVTGFIGSALARRLMDTGMRVFGLCRVESQNRSRIADLPRMELLECSGGDAETLRALLGRHRFRAVFNMATYGVHGDQQDDHEMRRSNDGLVVNLLSTLNDPGLVIHTGSCSEYGGGSHGRLLDEEAPTRPTTTYGHAKLRATRTALEMATRLRMPLTVLRLFHVYGPGEASTRLVPYLIDNLLRNEPVDLTPGTQVRDVLFIDDAVDACCAALRLGGSNRHRRLYNVCSSRPVTIRELGEQLARTLERPRELLRWGDRPLRSGEPDWLVGDNQCLREATGWRPQLSLADGLRAMVDRYVPEKVATEHRYQRSTAVAAAMTKSAGSISASASDDLVRKDAA